LIVGTTLGGGICRKENQIDASKMLASESDRPCKLSETVGVTIDGNEEPV